MTTFAPGDVVKLKSGGAAMTVKTVLTDNDVICQWFFGTDLWTNHFHPRMLEPAAADHRDTQ